MRIPRIYQPVSLSRGQLIELDGQAAVHLTRVLRLRVGDALCLFNGEGGEFAARLVAVGRRTVSIEVGEFSSREVESGLQLLLAQGVSRGERMDYTVQKAVELGVSCIVPLETARTTVNLEGERRTKRLTHWQGVVNAACEQSGRNRVPRVEAVQGLDEWLATVGPSGLKLVLHHRADKSLAGLPSPEGTVSLLIGPEGGLSEAEIDTAIDHGFQPLRLGPRVLRTETAALSALSVLQWLWGDFD
ncbi:MAG: 16S rRNA (uracil(1498)-N(3))-methyltransferase [Gammaproteobacteria bacterium]|nr:16S rRNA (uracil(1498)-N(3))-methyltransferase [Gammaproteobacteria bacterium]